MAQQSTQETSILTELSSTKSFGGFVKKFEHNSVKCDCTMKLSVFLPPQATKTNKVPALWWLSGLTCTEDNFMQKAGAQRFAAQYGLALICPDTSPRGVSIEGDDEWWDFGTGAGFYVNATEEKWKAHYNMYDYIVEELPLIVCRELPIEQKSMSISGHSMGGHGALVIGLRNARLFKAISAFAPIAKPSDCPWGVKAFTGYLGENKEDWMPYDSCNLLEKYSGDRVDILVDQGKADKFLEQGQLRTDDLRKAAGFPNNASVVVRMQAGYDHSYFFVASFIESHIEFHARRLGLIKDDE